MEKKSGLLWMSKRTNQLRYSTKGENWLQPLSTYIAGHSILRGQPLSIALKDDISGDSKVVDAGITDDDSIVVKTNTLRHLKSVGLAMQNVSAGEKVHVINIGKMTFDNTKSEYNPQFVDADRGKLVFIGPTPGEFTLDEREAVLGARNLIQIGFITSTSVELPNAGTFDIEVQLEGDGRGPLDSTTFEFTAGQNHDTSVYAVPSVFAVGQDVQARNHKSKLIIKKPVDNFPMTGAYIGFYTANNSWIYSFGASPQGTDTDSSNMLQYLLKKTNSVTQVGLVQPAAWGDFDAQGGELTNGTDKLLDDVKAFVESIPGLNTGAPLVLTLDENSFQTEAVFSITGGEEPIHVVMDTSLQDRFTHTEITKGTTANAGKAVLADSRYSDRLNVLGLYLESRDMEIDSSCLFLRQGIYNHPSDVFIPGQTYYLGIDGKMTPYILKQGETVVKIGIARSERQLMVDISYPIMAGGYNAPIGLVKPLMPGIETAEYGFVLMNGQVLTQEYYPDLYKVLVRIYGDDKITIGESFIVPELYNGNNENYYQIKANNYDSDTAIASSVTHRVGGQVSQDGGINTIADVDVTDLAFTGIDHAYEEMAIDSLVPKLYVKINLLGVDEFREIPAGFMYKGADLYGYSFYVENEGDKKILKLDTRGGKGLYYVDGNGFTDLSGLDYKLTIIKPSVFAKYSDFDLDIAEISLDSIDTSKDKPVNSRAVVEYIDNDVTTDEITVRHDTNLGTDKDDQLIVKATATFQAGTYKTTLDEDGLIKTTHPMTLATSMVSNAYVAKSYVDEHINSDITSAKKFHGIQQGKGNNFDADMVDGVHVNQYVNETATVPTIEKGATHLGHSLRLHAAASATKHVDDFNLDITTKADGVALLKSDKDSLVLGIGGNNSQGYLGYNGAVLEILSTETLGVDYAHMKAASFKTASSREYKKDIEDYEQNALELLNAVNVVSYVYKSDETKEVQIGFIAEDTPEVLAGQDHKEMNVSSTIGVLIKAVQELTILSQNQTQQIADLQRLFEESL